MTKKLNKKNKNYWLDKGYSEDEAIFNARSRIPVTKEYWLNRGHSEDEAISISKKISRKRSHRCVEHWLDKGYSEDEAKKIISEKQSKNSERHILYWLDKGYSEDEAKKIISEKQKEHNKKFLLGKSDEEIEIFNRKRSHRCVEHWLDKGYSEDEAKKIISEKQRNNTSLEGFNSRYGEVLGNEKYKKYLKRVNNNNKLSTYIKKHGETLGTELWLKKYKKTNKQSNFHKKILDLIVSNYKNDEKLYYGDNEFGLKNGNLYYFYDFVDTRNNICIEFNGDYWHCNPLLYEENYWHSRIKKTAKDIWDYDKEKIEKIKKKGFDTFIIWESDDIEEKVRKIYENKKY